MAVGVSCGVLVGVMWCAGGCHVVCWWVSCGVLVGVMWCAGGCHVVCLRVLWGVCVAMSVCCMIGTDVRRYVCVVCSDVVCLCAHGADDFS